MLKIRLSNTPFLKLFIGYPIWVYGKIVVTIVMHDCDCVKRIYYISYYIIDNLAGIARDRSIDVLLGML